MAELTKIYLQKVKESFDEYKDALNKGLLKKHKLRKTLFDRLEYKMFLPAIDFPNLYDERVAKNLEWSDLENQIKEQFFFVNHY